MPIRHLIVLALAAGVFACATDQRPAADAAPSAALSFIDLPGFDQQLAGSLGAPLQKVEVSFYDRVVPSTLPERLQKWMAAVEAGGGKVSVTPPPSDVSARNPLLLISAISTLWTANKMAREAATEARFRAARGHDAQLVLKRDEKGDAVVDKVIFVRSAR